jgi:hypothetical protein
MKRRLTLLSAIFLALGATVQPSLAHDPWFDRWDHDHNGAWNYSEYAAAQRDWAYRHHYNPWAEARMRAEFSHWDRDHNRALRAEEAAAWHSHHW